MGTSILLKHNYSVYVTVNLRIQEIHELLKFQEIQGFTDSAGDFMNSQKFQEIHEFTRILPSLLHIFTEANWLHFEYFQ